MTYTTTLHEGQLTIPTGLLHEAGLTGDAAVIVRPANGGLVIEPITAEYTFEAAEARFPNEWIFMVVTQRDAVGMALGGYMMAHASDHDWLAAQARLWIEAHPGQLSALFFSGDPQGVVIV